LDRDQYRLHATRGIDLSQPGPTPAAHSGRVGVVRGSQLRPTRAGMIHVKRACAAPP